MSLIEAIEAAWADELQSRRSWPNPNPRSYVWASGRRKCVRAMALDLLHPEDREVPDLDALERMQRGDEREDCTVARLKGAGRRCDPPFQVVEGQSRFEIKTRDGRTAIAGRVDGRLVFGNLKRNRPVFEIKSGMAVQRIQHFEDFERSQWTRHMPDQLLAYLLGAEEEWGFLMLDRPQGLPRLIEVRLEDHLERAEAFVQDATVAVEARFGERELPPCITDVLECRRCDHLGKSCAPDWVTDRQGLRIIEDPDLEEQARIYTATLSAHRDHEKAARKLKEGLRGVEHGILGDYSVAGKWRPRSRLELPKELRERYTKRIDHGSWHMEIEHVQGGG